MVIHETRDAAAKEQRELNEAEFTAKREAIRALAKVLHSLKRLDPMKRLAVLWEAVTIVRGDRK